MLVEVTKTLSENLLYLPTPPHTFPPLPTHIHTCMLASPLRTVTWGRQADDLCMYPSPLMIRLVDKKFGGELTKADVMGVEVRDGWGV